MSSYRFAHIAIVGLLLLLTPAALAQSDPKAFYHGKSINMLIGYPAGGTYDLYARTIARYLGRHLSGDTKVVSQNMPGAATLQAARHVYNVAAQDGTSIAALSSSMPFLSLFQEADPVYDPIKANWLPTPSSFTTLMIVWHKVPVKTVEDLRGRETIMSTLAPGATPHFMASVVNVVLGTRIKAVTGFSNMNASLLAMERGEMEGYPTVPMSAILRTYAKQWKSGEFRPLIQIGAKKDKDAGDVPLLRDIVKNEQDRRLVDLATSPLALGYPYMMGPGVPPERVAFMRKAFMDVFRDKEFLAEAQKLTLEIDPVDGDKVQAMISDAHNAPPEMRAKLRAIFEGKHN
jgi:tripartite-type tricarboxylate transporter receptor subunit TctC